MNNSLFGANLTKNNKLALDILIIKASPLCYKKTVIYLFILHWLIKLFKDMFVRYQMHKLCNILYNIIRYQYYKL